MRALIAFLLFSLLGCGAQFRSPVVVKRNPEEQSSKVLASPPPSLVSGQTQQPTAENASLPPRSEVQSEPVPIPPGDDLLAPGAASASSPTGGVEAARKILILAKDDVTNTAHQLLERIAVRDVSQGGFSEQEAREALQYEAVRRFGEKAKGITNIEYRQETNLIPGTTRYSEVSGDVITW